MKKLLILALSLLAVGNYSATAQEKKSKAKQTADKVADDTKDAAKKVGNKTAELSVKGASAVTDKIYKDKQGPDGQTIYINSHSKYYWVDKKGKKVYISEAKLKNK